MTWGGDSSDFGLHRVAGMPKDAKIKKIAAGASFSMVVAGEGQVYAWGSGVDGRLGVGNLKNYRNPQKVTFEYSVKVVKVALGKAHALAVTEQGNVFSWGCGNKGQLGLGDENSRMTPVQIPGLTNIKYACAGESHSVALSDKGLVFTWGDGEHGQLGLGNSRQEFSPVQVTGLPDEVQILKISAGQWHTMAITKFGDLFAWGNNAFGQLGLGHTNNINLPEFVDTLPERKFVIQAVGGEKHSVFLVSDLNLLENKNLTATAPKLFSPPAKPSSPAVMRSSAASSRIARRRSWRLSANSFESAFADIDKDLEQWTGEMDSGSAEASNEGVESSEGGSAVIDDTSSNSSVFSTGETPGEPNGIGMDKVRSPSPTEDKELIAKDEKQSRRCCGCTIM